MNQPTCGTIEERKRMVPPFAQGASSENNEGFFCRIERGFFKYPIKKVGA